MTKELQTEMHKTLEIYNHINAMRRYLTNVISYASEQAPETNMTIHLEENVTHLTAEQLCHILKGVDVDLYSLKIMYEFEMSETDDVLVDADIIDEMPPLPKMNFVITDNQHYRAEGKCIGVVANLFFEQIERGM